MPLPEPSRLPSVHAATWNEASLSTAAGTSCAAALVAASHHHSKPLGPQGKLSTQQGQLGQNGAWWCVWCVCGVRVGGVGGREEVGRGGGRERGGKGWGGRGGVVAATSGCARVAMCAISHCQPLVSFCCSPEGTGKISLNERRLVVVVVVCVERVSKCRARRGAFFQRTAHVELARIATPFCSVPVSSFAILQMKDGLLMTILFRCTSGDGILAEQIGLTHHRGTRDNCQTQLSHVKIVQLRAKRRRREADRPFQKQKQICQVLCCVDWSRTHCCRCVYTCKQLRSAENTPLYKW